MKRGLKVFIVIVIILALAAAGLYLWQKENIHAMIKVLTTDSETIAAELEQTRIDHIKELEEAAHVTVKVQPVSPQQSEDLLKGNVTAEQVQTEMGYDAAASETASGKEDIINQCVAELYAYKAEVMGYLGGIRQWAIDQWNALDKSQRTTAKKAELLNEGIGKCYGYEATVDGTVQEILARYRPKLIEIGEDPAPIDLLWNQYCDEKEAEKSYYLDRYMN